jgi:hypothetical protein
VNRSTSNSDPGVHELGERIRWGVAQLARAQGTSYEDAAKAYLEAQIELARRPTR